MFTELLEQKISTKLPLKSNQDIDEAVQFLTCSNLEAAWDSTLEEKQTDIPVGNRALIKRAITSKWRLRRIWQDTRSPADKNRLNKTTKELKKLLNDLRNQTFQNYLKCLFPAELIGYSLWKATKRMKQPKQPIPQIRNKDGLRARSDQEKLNYSKII